MKFGNFKTYKLLDLLDNFSLETNDIFYIDKPYGLSSFYVVSILKSRFGCKVGHGGTLDPLATGKLPILVDKATKQQLIFQNAKKVYRFTLIFPFYSETYDLESRMHFLNSSYIMDNIEILIHNKIKLNEIFDSFLGQKYYWVYKYSALKKRGVPMYKINGMPFKEKQFKVYEYKFKLQKLSKVKLISIIENKLSSITSSEKFLENINFKVQGTFKQKIMLNGFSRTIKKSLETIKQSSLPEFVSLEVQLKVSGGTYIRVLGYYLSAMLAIPGVIIDLQRENYEY